MEQQGTSIFNGLGRVHKIWRRRKRDLHKGNLWWRPRWYKTERNKVKFLAKFLESKANKCNDRNSLQILLLIQGN